MTADSIGSQARAGVKWTALGMVAVRLSRFAANILLAHLLARDAFGVIAMANAVLTVAGSLREAGIGQAFVQRRTAEEEGPSEAIDTVFVATLCINAMLTVALLASTPLIGSLFASSGPQVEPVFRALVLLFLLDPFDSTPRFLLQRQMRFDAIAKSEVAGAVANVLTAVGAAALGAGVWSLVAGYFADKTVTTLSLVARSGWRPGFGGSRRIARELVSYGKYLWGFALIRSAGGVLDKIVIGRTQGSARLGDYSLAFQLCTLPSTAISQLVNRVALPAMSRMQDDLSRMRAAFLKSLSHISFVCLPVGLGLISVSDVFVPVVYGEKWAGMIPIVDVLGVYGVMMAIASVCGPALQALGRPQYFFYTEIARRGALLALLLTIGGHSEVAVAWSVLAAFTLVTLPAFVLVSRMLQIGIWQLTGPLLRSAGASIAMLCAVRGVSATAGPHMSPPIELAVMILTGVIAYSGLSFAFNGRLVGEFVRTLGEVYRTRSA